MRENSAGIAERMLVASILNVDLDPFRQRVLLDKGARDGVFKGQAVLDGDGIVGQVYRVDPFTAEIILITDAEHAMPVQVEPHRRAHDRGRHRRRRQARRCRT